MSTVVPLPQGEAERLAEVALTEDLAGGVDVTTLATIGEDAHRVSEIIARVLSRR